MKLVLQKSKYAGKLQTLMERRGDKPDNRLEHFRGLILDHLSKLEKEDGGNGISKSMQKALNFIDKLAKGGKGLPVGTVREWRGKKYVKISMASGKTPGKWKSKYDSETRGAKMAVSAIKKKIAAAPDAQTMLQIVLENRDRFSDRNGNPLPFVEELSAYVEKEQNSREKPPKGKKAVEGKKKENESTDENKPQESKAAQPKGDEWGSWITNLPSRLDAKLYAGKVDEKQYRKEAAELGIDDKAIEAKIAEVAKKREEVAAK